MKVSAARVGIAVVVALVALVGAAVASAAKPRVGRPPPKLYAIVGKTASQLSLKDRHGKDVVHLKPGWYTLTISDESNQQRFRLRGPGIDRSTGGSFIGAAIWGVHLRKGKYRYQTVGDGNVSRKFSVK
jgi:hypothetical protein